MEILVINGSPKGENSVTLQTALYLEKRYPEHHFAYLHAGQRIGVLAKDFSPAAEAVARAELLIFCYPVYTFLAPSQLHRFLHLMKENGVEAAGKAATQLTTSKHFYDVTAHRYVRECLQDLGFTTLRGLSADMADLTEEKGRGEAESFFRRALWAMENGVAEDRTDFPEPLPETPASPLPDRMKTAETTVAVVADLAEDDAALKSMIDRFRAAAPFETRLINIREFPFKGGCLGCLRCAQDGRCVYTDGFDSFLRERVQSCAGTVYAFRVEEHSMGWRFKMYDDRQFCNGHRTVTMGSPGGYLVAGDLGREENLRVTLEARAQVGGNYPAGFADDCHGTDAAVDRLALSVADALENAACEPQNFYGVGGSKIFRDLIWQMRGIMTADHRFYKKHGFYDDLPQKKTGTMLAMCAVGRLMKLPRVKDKMNEGMLAPYKKVLENAGKEKA